ncbi:MAG: protein-L-isoaspartate(D-aspartate) O-methyltransferase [Spirochaetes bacterium]|nr:protein-L-isoaspartate(D-aspartate) O-methyltransferase [Spirochaetota bacterium]
MIKFRKSTLILFCLIFYFACRVLSDDTPGEKESAQLTQKREMMIKYQIKARGIKDKRLLKAMQKVQRHLFVPKSLWDQAYNDYPLPIGEGQTISQPYIVALMTELLELKGKEKVLEIGTGSGYQAAVLSELCKEVYTIEIVPALARASKKLLKEMGYKNVHVFEGDGYLGLEKQAPFEGIIVTCAPPYVPKPLKDQLKEGGRMVIPVGETYQELKVLTKQKGKIKEKSIVPVRFVPMTGKYIEGKIQLPKPVLKGDMSVEEAMYKRRSVRDYTEESLSLKEVSQLLWAAGGVNVDGITGASRTAPSAGGLYPYDLYLVAFNVKELEKGLYEYVPEENILRHVKSADLRAKIVQVTYFQGMFKKAAAMIVYAMDYAKVEARYGSRGKTRYAHMDIGHSAENVYLQCESLGIGTVAVGSFDDRAMGKVLDIGKDIVYLLPLGKKK